MGGIKGIRYVKRLILLVIKMIVLPLTAIGNAEDDVSVSKPFLYDNTFAN
jgi:hypothetical protein